MLKFGFAAAAAMVAVGIAGGASAASPITVTVEAAGAQATTSMSPAYVEDFSQDFGNLGPGTPTIPDFVSNFGGSPLTATFSGFELGTPSSYGGVGAYFGGVGGTIQYGVVHQTATITFQSGGFYNFGLWAAALDGANTVELFHGATSLGAFNLVSAVGSLGAAYYGNPNNGLDGNEPFAFVNFASTTPITSVKFWQNGGGGFEFDNVTISGVVPEPASWALMITGFGLAGAALRSRRRLGAQIAA